MKLEHELRDVEHPFARFVRILGKGKKGSRDLTEQEAFESFCMILNGDVAPEQLGAYMMLMRFKEETPEEMAGFVKACRELVPRHNLSVDIDWPSYAGKKRQHPWYLLAAKALAKSGYRIVIHGGDRHTTGRLYTEDCLLALDIPECHTTDKIEAALASHNIAFWPLATMLPRLQDIINLRNLFGLRSPVHSLTRIINPTNAKLSVQGIFHPGYQNAHQQAAALLGDQAALIIKGDGGEFECRPDKDNVLYLAAKGTSREIIQPSDGKFLKRTEEPSVEAVVELWNSTESNAASDAIIQTIAAVLAGWQVQESGLNGIDLGQARQSAIEIWDSRLS